MIKSAIPIWDIRTHIHYFYIAAGILHQTREDVDAEPDSVEDKFWSRACFLVGTSITILEGYEGYEGHEGCAKPEFRSWFLIARDCVENDGFCGYPDCGGSLLEYSGKLEIKNLTWKESLIILEGSKDDAGGICRLKGYSYHHYTTQAARRGYIYECIARAPSGSTAFRSKPIDTL